MGDAIQHAKFGRGVITAVEPDGEFQELTIDFDGNERTLMTRYAAVSRV